MPTWRLKPPASFPPHYERAMKGLAESLLRGEEGVRFQISTRDWISGSCMLPIQRKFHYYRWCIRHYPFSEFHQIELDYNIKTTVETLPMFGCRMMIYAQKRTPGYFAHIEKILQT